jgi:hypothetical protein
MSERSRSSPPSSRGGARSGEHPVVVAYRAKLESVRDGVTAATNELDQALQEFLTALKTPIPPKPSR